MMATWKVEPNPDMNIETITARSIVRLMAYSPGQKIGLLSPTMDISRLAVAFLADRSELLVERYQKQIAQLVLWNGSTIAGFSERSEAKLRGPMFHSAVIFGDVDPGSPAAESLWLATKLPPGRIYRLGWLE